jgi:hypothetical protein
MFLESCFVLHWPGMFLETKECGIPAAAADIARLQSCSQPGGSMLRSAAQVVRTASGPEHLQWPRIVTWLAKQEESLLMSCHIYVLDGQGS